MDSKGKDTKSNPFGELFEGEPKKNNAFDFDDFPEFNPEEKHTDDDATSGFSEGRLENSFRDREEPHEDEDIWKNYNP